MYFDPKTNLFPYPEDTDKHYLQVKKNKGIVFDNQYPYIDRSKRFRFLQKLFRLFYLCLLMPVTFIRLGLKVHGKKNLRKYKDVIQKGIISTCNHVHLWDYLGILGGIRPHKPNILIWAPNINGEFGTPMRLLGGIPIPEGDLKATAAYLSAVEKEINNGGWLHIYAEGSMWEYYAPIRPFKRGPAFIACRTNKPILPLAYSYRKPNWIRRNIFRQFACFDLHIGEPIYPDTSLPMKERELDLTRRVHEATCLLAGIDPKENVYPPIFNNSKRVDYYTSTYGASYKGSH